MHRHSESSSLFHSLKEANLAVDDLLAKVMASGLQSTSSIMGSLTAFHAEIDTGVHDLQRLEAGFLALLDK